MSVFGMKFEGWRKATQKAGSWFRRVEEGAELLCGIGMKRRDAKLQSDAQRLRQRHPPLASLSSRGEGGRGGAMPKRLKSGFGHHRLEICAPSNGRHKIA